MDGCVNIAFYCFYYSHVGVHDPFNGVTLSCPVDELSQDYEKHLQVLQ